MGNVFKGSVFLALILALLAIVLGFVQIGTQLSHSGFSDSKGKHFAFGLQEPGVALVHLSGIIRAGDDPGGVDPMIDVLEEAKENPNIRAVLLVVNSPGGSVGATKRLYTQLQSLRKVKPVVAAVDDLAASGAYYAASACSRIVAAQGATLGSIGVISFHLELHRLLERHGIQAEAFKAGRFKDLGSPFREMTAVERKMHQELLNEFYSLFLKDVAAGRDQPLAKVRTWAEGRLFSARKALSLKMIDMLGGHKQALEEIKKLLKTKEELRLIKPKRNIEYYLEKYLSRYLSFSPTSDYQHILRTPFLYLYPELGFLRMLRILHVTGN